MNFLTCEPNLKNKANYMDEADLFFENPSRWLEKNSKIVNKATYIVLFENLYNDIANTVNYNTLPIIHKFYVCHKHFYSLTKQTKTTDKKLFILCLRKSKKPVTGYDDSL